MSRNMIETVITFIVGGGLITLITQIGKSWGSFRKGRLTTTREVIRDLAAARDEAEDREADCRGDADYWRQIAAAYGYQLRSAGQIPDPPKPMSPTEARREADRRANPSRRARLADRAPTTEEIRRVDVELHGDRRRTGNEEGQDPHPG